MHKRWTALTLAMLLMLPAACGKREAPSDPSDSVSSSSQSSNIPVIGPVHEDTPLDGLGMDTDYFETATPWEYDRTLSPELLPDSYNGLELPVQGATGYTSIQMPLWAEIEDCQAAKTAVEEWRLAQEEAARQQELENQASAAPPSSSSASGGNGEDSAEIPAVSASAQPDIQDSADLAEEVGDDPFPPITDQPEVSDPSDPTWNPSDPGVGLPESPQALPEAPQDPLPTQGEENGEPSAGEEPTLTDGALTILPSGTPFTILQEEGDWWQIAVEADYTDEEENLLHGELTGWVQHLYCFINLPDVIPSIIYDATNSYSSRFVSCGKVLQGITSQALYPSATYNHRLGEKEFMMPVLYSMSFRLCAAQRNALKEGNSLILYEGYRPHEVQTKVLNTLSALTKTDPEVKAAVTNSPWNISWFISGGYSNHQRGYAVDVGLAKVTGLREASTGGYRYLRVRDYELYQMPSPIHELSRAACTFTKPVAINSTTAWKTAELAPTMNQPALGLQRYCTDAELTPLASEWWHFNDLGTRSMVLENQGIGDFVISTNRSTAP